ncbi:folylpolyglutamate synthase/dihydrofolate synthase family protein [soil metagenome]
MTTYEQAIARLVTARRFGVVLGLDRMRELLATLGSPEKRLGWIIHVAGTNGKGSTVAMITSMLRAAGLRVGMYTSPHLNELRERIAIDGEPIAYDDFARCADRVVDAGGGEMTFFEQVTAIAFCAFADARLDATVIEVGLGGRLDATNVVESHVAVVTGVALDHEAILGDTIEAIAREKAGIFKRDSIAVIGRTGDGAAFDVLVGAAKAVGAAVLAAPAPTGDEIVALHGGLQQWNAALAEEALRALARRGGPHVDAAAMARGLATVVHPGRYEVFLDVTLSPQGATPIRVGRVILDGAHNPDAASGLAAAVRAEGRKPVLILGLSADKNLRGVIGALIEDVSAVVTTRARNDRAMSPLELAVIVREVAADRGLERPVRESGTLLGAFYSLDGLAPDVAIDKRTVLVAGSLFLVGEAREVLLGVRSDPPNATDPPVTAKR